MKAPFEILEEIALTIVAGPRTDAVWLKIIEDIQKDAIQGSEEEIKRWKACEAVCHCGAGLYNHNPWDLGHAAVPMKEPCPFEEQLKEARRNYDRLHSAVMAMRRGIQHVILETL